MDVARVMVDEEHKDDRGRLVLRHWRNGFLQWKESHWEEREVRSVRSDAYAFTEHAQFIVMKGDTAEWRPWAPNRYKVADLLDATSAVCHLPERLQPPAWSEKVEGSLPANELVAVRNGLLHVMTRQLLAHDPRYFNLVGVPFDYEPEPASPELWHRFLADLWPDDPDSVKALQEFFGYVLSGRTDLHKILLLIGPTRAGKGVIARVLRTLLGKANCAGPTLAGLGTNFGMQELVNKPLAIISDARLGRANSSVVVERLLSISGEDALTVDRKYRDPWTGQLPTRFVVISNELPRFGDSSGAIANRFVVLALQESWLGREDVDLTKKLLSELPGIMNWALDGLERLQLQGRFTEPASSTDAMMALHDLASPVSAFVREKCTVGPIHEVAIEDLYNAWKRWAEDNGHRASSAQTFGRDLRAVIPGLRRIRPRDGEESRRPHHYRGLRLGSKAHNGEMRGPSWTTLVEQEEHANGHGPHRGPGEPDSPPVHSGPRTTPLSALADEEPF